MFIENISEVLKKRFEKNNLAHFYLVRFDSDFYSSQEISLEISKIFYPQFEISHPDIFLLNLDKEETSYKVNSENFEQFISYLNYAPVNLSHKFGIINDGHLISEILFNKLLKTLEELAHNQTLFLLVPKHQKIPATIISRSIELTISNSKKVETGTSSHRKNLSELLADFKKSKLSENEALENILGSLNDESTFLELHNALINLKQFETASIFHNSLSSRLASLLP